MSDLEAHIEFLEELVINLSRELKRLKDKIQAEDNIKQSIKEEATRHRTSSGTVKN